MENTTLCPTSGKEVPGLASSQLHSGNLYEIVPEGEQFAIVFRGEVKIRGLAAEDLAKAKGVIAILNSVIDEVEKAG